MLRTDATGGVKRQKSASRDSLKVRTPKIHNPDFNTMGHPTHLKDIGAEQEFLYSILKWEIFLEVKKLVLP